jgi:hypothetical protein
MHHSLRCAERTLRNRTSSQALKVKDLYGGRERFSSLIVRGRLGIGIQAVPNVSSSLEGEKGVDGNQDLFCKLQYISIFSFQEIR